MFPILKSMEQFKFNSHNEILLAEVITGNDPRRWKEEFIEANTKEIDGLVLKGAFTIVNMSLILNDANMLGERLVLVVKNLGAMNKVSKARSVAQSNADFEKNMVVHASNGIRY